MGMKNGKYDFQQSNSLPINDSEISHSIYDKRTQQSEASLPKCLHHRALNDSHRNENVTVVWLDTYIHERLSNIDTEVKLKNLFHYVRIFDRVDQCEKFIKQIGKMNNNHNNMKKDTLLVIISTNLAPTLTPHLHDLSQVKFIYVYGKSRTISRAHQTWLQKYNKVNIQKFIFL